MKNKLTIKIIARYMNKGEEYVREGLKRGTLPFGSAQKFTQRYNYYINPKLVEEYFKVPIEEIINKNLS